MNEDLEIRKQQATVEWRKIIDWAIAEEDKVSEQLEREGAVRGLDTNHERFAYIKKTVDSKVQEILQKYGLLERSQTA